MWDDIFRNPGADAAALRRLLRRPPPHTVFAVHFTPRSGSSWLTEVLSRSQALGAPGEIFNPAFVPQIARKLNATSREEYVHAIQRRRARGGVFGFEATGHDVKAVFGSYDTFQTYFGQATDFWLLREDIVLQAVSLFKMAAVRVSHSTQVTAGALDEADSRFAYDSRQIERWITHLMVAERRTEAYFADWKRRPWRLSYERITAAGADAVEAWFADRLGVTLPAAAPEAAETGHRQLRTDKNTEFAERYRAENPELVAAIEAERRPRLAALDDPRCGGPGVAPPGAARPARRLRPSG